MTLAVCRNVPPCPWEIDVAADKVDVREATHMQRAHADAPPATDELCDRLVAEHDRERELIITAIKMAADRNGGKVDPNFVRSIVPPGVTPQLVGAVYNVLRRRGALVPDGTTTSTDTKGRNVGKPQTTYRLVREEAMLP